MHLAGKLQQQKPRMHILAQEEFQPHLLLWWPLRPGWPVWPVRLVWPVRPVLLLVVVHP